MNNKDIAILIGCCAGLIFGGALIGNGLRGIKERKKKKDFNNAVTVIMYNYNHGVQFSKEDIEFLKEHGFDDRVYTLIV